MLDIKNIYEELNKRLPKKSIVLNANMKEYTSFKIGGKSDILVTVRNIEEMKKVLEIANHNNCPIFVLGNGTNILVKDEGIRGIVVRNRLDKLEFLEKDGEVLVQSGVKNATLAQRLLKEGLSGFEFASRNSWNNRWSN